MGGSTDDTYNRCLRICICGKRERIGRRGVMVSGYVRSVSYHMC